MKKTILIITTLFVMILATLYGLLINKRANIMNANQANKYYEKYLNKEIYGTDVATIINKAINENEENEVEKDSNNLYIENDTNSIKIDIKMITIDKTYPMETFYNNGITRICTKF